MGDDERSAPPAKPAQVSAHLEDVPDRALGYYLLRFARSMDSAIFQQVDCVRYLKRVVDIVEYGYDSLCEPVSQVDQDGQKLPLKPQIHVSDRLVQKNDRGILG